MSAREHVLQIFERELIGEIRTPCKLAIDLVDALSRAGLQITPSPGYDHSGNDNHLVAGDHGPVITPQAEAEPVAWASAKEFAMLANGNTAMVSARRTLSGDVPLYRTAPPRPVAPEPMPEGMCRAALLWVLWHHQGGSSDVGQPIRFALGMGAHEPLSAEQVEAAKSYGALTKKWPPDSPGTTGGS